MSSPLKRASESASTDGSAPDAKKARQESTCRSIQQYSESEMTNLMSRMSSALPDRVPTDAQWVRDGPRVKLMNCDGKPVEFDLAPRKIVGFWAEDGSNCKLQMLFDPDDDSAGHKFLEEMLSTKLIEAYAEHAPELWSKPPRIATKKGMSERGFDTLEDVVRADVLAGPGVRPEAFNTPFKVNAEDKNGDSKHKFGLTLYTLQSGNGMDAPASTMAEARDSLAAGHPLLAALSNGDCDLANLAISVADRRGAGDLSSLKTLGKMSFKTPGEGGRWMVMAGAALRIGGVSFKWLPDRKCFTLQMFLNGPGLTCVGLYESSVGGDTRPPAAASNVYDSLGIDVDPSDAYNNE